MRYIAKPDTWFDEGTEVYVRDDLCLGSRRGEMQERELCMEELTAVPEPQLTEEERRWMEEIVSQL